jgi:uncharacterized protein YneF (UPF0154 family)
MGDDLGMWVTIFLCVLCIGFFALMGWVRYLVHKEIMRNPKIWKNENHTQDGYFYSKTTKKTTKEV